MGNIGMLSITDDEKLTDRLLSAAFISDCDISNHAVIFFIPELLKFPPVRVSLNWGKRKRHRPASIECDTAEPATTTQPQGAAIMNASDVLVECLLDWGVNTIFGLPGDGINGIMESLRTHQDKIRFIHVRHEEAAAFMACGYAKYTGKARRMPGDLGPGRHSPAEWSLRCQAGRRAGAGDYRLAISRSDRHTHPAGCGARQVVHGCCVFNERVMGADPRGEHGGSGLPYGSLLPRRRAHHHSCRFPGAGVARPERSKRNIHAPHSAQCARKATRFREQADLRRAAHILNAGQESRNSCRARRFGCRRRTGSKSRNCWALPS